MLVSSLCCLVSQYTPFSISEVNNTQTNQQPAYAVCTIEIRSTLHCLRIDQCVRNDNNCSVRFSLYPLVLMVRISSMQNAVSLPSLPLLLHLLSFGQSIRFPSLGCSVLQPINPSSFYWHSCIDTNSAARNVENVTRKKIKKNKDNMWYPAPFQHAQVCQSAKRSMHWLSLHQRQILPSLSLLGFALGPKESVEAERMDWLEKRKGSAARSEIEVNKGSKQLGHIAGGQRLCMDMDASVSYCMAQDCAGHYTTTHALLHDWTVASRWIVVCRCYRRCFFVLSTKKRTSVLMHF